MPWIFLKFRTEALCYSAQKVTEGIFSRKTHQYMAILRPKMAQNSLNRLKIAYLCRLREISTLDFSETFQKVVSYQYLSNMVGLYPVIPLC